MKNYSHVIMRMQPANENEGWLGHPQGFTWQPLLDIFERPEGISIVAELPGVEKDQVNVTVEHNMLSISGVRQKAIPADTQRVHQMEIPYGPFARSVELPAESDTDRIAAKYERGYLTIEIPWKGAV